MPITAIVLHHTAGVIDIENLGSWFAKPTTRASSNYGIGPTGRIGMYMPEEYMACTSSSYWADARSVTIEVSNSAKYGDWPVSDAALAATIDLVTDVCWRNNIYPCTYTGDTRGTLYRHDWFEKKICPGPYLGSKFPMIAEEATRRLTKMRAEAAKPAPDVPTYYTYAPAVYELLRTIYSYDKPSGKVKSKLAKGTVVTAVEEIRSGVPGVWNKLDTGEYIQAQEWKTINIKQTTKKPTLKPSGSPVYHDYPPGNYELLRNINVYDKADGKIKSKLTKGTIIKAVKEIRAGVPGVWVQLDSGGFIQAQEWKTINIKQTVVKPTKKSVAEIAKDVRAGKYGNEPERPKNLKAAGYSNYAEIKAEVNRQEKEASKGATSGIKVGDKVRVKRSATKYATGQLIPGWVKNRRYTVEQVSGTRILLREITSWVYIADLDKA